MPKHRTLLSLVSMSLVTMLLSLPMAVLMFALTPLYVRFASQSTRTKWDRIFGTVDVTPPQICPQVKQPDQFPDHTIEMDIRER